MKSPIPHLAGDDLDECRRRVQRATCEHRGRKRDPLKAARRTLLTGDDPLTDKQRKRLMILSTDQQHVEVEATYGIYQRMITPTASPTAPTTDR